MTAPLVTPYGNRYIESALEAGCDRALTHLARPVHHTIPGTLWERIAETAEKVTA